MRDISWVEVTSNSDNDGVTITFIFDNDRHLGALTFEHKIYIYYNTKTDSWSGDEINSDGWITLSPSKVMQIVKKHQLRTMVTGYISNEKTVVDG